MLNRTLVNRHTGGLESLSLPLPKGIKVNRHTGGLEIWCADKVLLNLVNRHTGGLEKIQAQQIAQDRR